jgi:hypothetical protein
MWALQKSKQQKEHAKQPADQLPQISPSGFLVMRRGAYGADRQTDK